MWINKVYIIVFILIIFGLTSVKGQDIIVRTNGAQIDANVVEIGEDSVWFKNKNMYGSPLLALPKSDIKMIEYWNGKKDYFHGSYVNLSEEETTLVVTGIDAGHKSVRVNYILFTLENLFTENHLIIDYTEHEDSLFTVSKGKMEFVFNESKNNFFVKIFPIDEKTVFTKFEFIDGAVNKKYDRLSNKKLAGLEVYMNDSVNIIPLDTIQSESLQHLFSSKDFKN